MKRILMLMLAFSMCMSVTACGGSENLSMQEAETEAITEPTTEETIEETFPSYQTMALTPSELVEDMNKSATTPFGTDYTTTDNGDGTSDFEISEKIFGVNYSGTLENASQKIITLTGIMKLEDEQKEDEAVAAMLGVGILSQPIVSLFNKTSKEAIGMLMTACSSESLCYEMDDYIIITLGFAAGMPSMLIAPKEKEDTSDGVVGDNNHDGVVDESDWEIEWKDYLNNKLKNY